MKRKRPGCWSNEVYVKTGGSSLVPVVFEPFSTKEEGFPGRSEPTEDDMDAIRAWFFLIMVAFSLLFAPSGGREILRWITRFAEAFPKEVRFACYRILRGSRRSLQSLRDPLTILVSRPRAS